MSGLLRRIRRPGAAEETRTEATTPAPAHGSAPEAPATSEDGQRLPAGIAPEDLERRGATGRRSRLRRRARFLRRARELALRDLGGLVYEARRREQDGGKLVEDKVARLAALDSELGGIEATLGIARGETVIREPGVGGTCARCGELHGSDARFCSHCGVNLEEAAAEAAAEGARGRREGRGGEAEAEKVAAAKAEAEKAEAEKAAAKRGAPKESSDGAGNGRPAVKADGGRRRKGGCADHGAAGDGSRRGGSADHRAARGRRARDQAARMSEVATPPPATEQRSCPQCGSPLAPDQEWCLNCGHAVGTRIAPTPRWRVPVAIVGAVLALLVAALVLSLVELSGDPQPVAKAPTSQATATPSVPPEEGGSAAATPTPDAATPTPTPANGENAVPTTTPTPAPATGGTVGTAQWPSGKTAWTVVVASSTSRAAAQKKAKAAGADAGVLHSNDFSSLRKGYWVVFAGQYPDQKAALAAAKGRGGDAYARRVVPR